MPGKGRQEGGNSGGERPNAGRKPRAETFEKELIDIDQALAKGAKKRLLSIEKLADGGLFVKTKTFKAAGVCLITHYEDILKTVWEMETDEFGDETGQKIQVERPTGKQRKQMISAFPLLDPEQMVCISETSAELGPNLAANTYLLNRFVGTPPKEEPAVEEGAGEQLPQPLDQAVEKIYAEPTEPMETMNSS